MLIHYQCLVDERVVGQFESRLVHRQVYTGRITFIKDLTFVFKGNLLSLSNLDESLLLGVFDYSILELGLVKNLRRRFLLFLFYFRDKG